MKARPTGGYRLFGWTLAAALAGSALGLAPTAAHAQETGYTAPRTADGTPDLNGIWQALNNAHWNVEPQAADFSPVRALGALGAVPGGLGVVEGDTIPYTPEALAQRNENFANRLERDPAIKCYLPGTPRAMYMPYPFQIIQSRSHIMILHEFAGAGADHLHGGPHGVAGRHLDGVVERTLGRRDPRGRDGRLLRVDVAGPVG